MKLIKVKGIVIKEVQFKENDKIITILTDELGKIACISKGAKKTNSPNLASSQFLVYSEFVLYQGNNFYYVNSSSVINMFYQLRIDYDKMEIAFELARLVQQVTDENQDTSQVLKLFLNTVYVIENKNMNPKVVCAIFKIKLFVLLGFCPNLSSCSECGQAFMEQENSIYYDYVGNVFYCTNCALKVDKKRLILLSKATLIAIIYVTKSDIKKIFSFSLKETKDFELFGQVYADAMSCGI